MNQQEEVELILAILGIIVVYIFGKLWWKTMNLPPGPFPLPLAGNFPDLGYKMWRGRAMVEILRGWQKKYGNVFTLWIGPMPTVNLCSFDTATEAMIKKGIHFVDRPKLFLFDVVRKGRGILVSNGVQWTEQRRFALHALKNMGMGKNLMEERILMEIDYRKQYLTSEIDRHGWELLVNPRALFELTVGNIINRILFSERFTQENEEEFFRLKYKIDENMEKASIFDFFIDEWNVKYPPFKQRLERMMPSSMAMLDFVKERIRERKAEIALGKHPLKGEDFVDAFLLQMEHPDADKEIFNEEALAINLMDLWFAGQETTTTVLYWAFALLLLHEDVLHKVQEELDEVTGKDRTQHLTMADRLRTPYFNATVTEILRIACIFPLNLWRTAADDVQVAGYNIKKGTAVTAQLSLIMTDPKFFKQADKFIPERFLGEDGRKLEAMTVAFGMGKRQCLGESLARAEIYLILGNLLLSYDIAKDPENPPSMKAGREIGGFRRAQSYNIVIRRRK